MEVDKEGIYKPPSYLTLLVSTNSFQQKVDVRDSSFSYSILFFYFYCFFLFHLGGQRQRPWQLL